MREIGESTQMLIRDNNVCFWFCSVSLCQGLAEASAVTALEQLRGVLKVKHRMFSLTCFGFWIQ